MIEGERARLLEGLLPRRACIEEEMLEHLAGGPVWSKSGGLVGRASVAAWVECWFFAFECGEPWHDAAPAAVSRHARDAAKWAVGLARLLCCYLDAGDVLWRNVVSAIEHVEAREMPALLRQGWAATQSLRSCVVDAVRDAYEQEVARQAQTSEQRQTVLVRRLLKGDQSVDLREIRHNFSMPQLGLVASGKDAERLLHALRAIGQLICVREHDGTLIVWLAVQGKLTSAGLERYLSTGLAQDLTIAVGQVAGGGMDGFIETYRQATEAFLVAQLRPQRITWHVDVELDALLLRDRALARSLIAHYVMPLDLVLQQTLRAYCAALWNKRATARALDISPNTIHERLKKVQAIVGRPLDACHADIELALRAVDLKISCPDSAICKDKSNALSEIVIRDWTGRPATSVAESETMPGTTGTLVSKTATVRCSG